MRPVKVLFIVISLVFAMKSIQGLSLPAIGIRSQEGIIRIYKESDRFVNREPSDRQYVEMIRTKLLRGQYCYTLGERINGDKLVNQQDDSNDYPAARDVEATIFYPKGGTGTGSTITFIQIIVEQSSENGKGLIIEGGIYQNSVKILIIANSTTHYTHSAAFYGY